MRIDSLLQTGLPASAVNISAVLRTLDIGDVIKARVLEIKANELILQLLDGTMFKAAAMADTGVTKGQLITLMVNGKNENQVFAEIVRNAANTPSQEQEIFKELLSLGLTPDEDKAEILKHLKLNNLPVNKEIINLAADAASKFKIGPEKAVFFIANDIEPTEENIRSLAQLAEGKLKIGAKLEELIKMLDDTAVLDNTVDESKAAVNAFKKELESLFIRVNSEKAESGLDAGRAVKGLYGEVPARLLSKDILNEDILSKYVLSRELLSRDILSRLADIALKFKGDPEKAVFFLAKDIQLPEKDIGFLIQPAAEESKIAARLEELVKMLDNTAMVDDKEADENKAAAVDAFKKELQNLLTKVNQEKFESGEKAKSLYENLLARLRDIKEALSSSNPSNVREIISRAEDLENSVKFLNSINSHSTYVQIPLIINDKTTTGELYILKRGPRRKKIDPERVSLLISLNTHSLGLVESLININKRNINLNIRAESERIIDFIKDNYVHLYNSLSDKGYKLVDVRYSLIDKGINILNAVESLEREFSIRGNSIDYRV